MASDEKRPNRLIQQTSPYLLQHAYNPVDWYPWGEEAFDKAIKEDKLVFLSIGYSSCHWCQVMEKEVFENTSIADILNKDFISIKVDREERPDLDRIYMYAVQMMSGHGGWPLNVFLTPEKVPVFGGSYFPPEKVGELPGFGTILSSLKSLYADHRSVLIENTNKISKALQSIGKTTAKVELDKRLLENHYRELKLRYDSVYGGFGSAPKFPNPMHLNTLLLLNKRSNNEDAVEMVNKTLHKMANGSIMDQIGGGFHRYATDREWKIPHFEKMCTDQALISDTYLMAYRKTKNRYFLKVAEKTLEYVIRELTSPDGGFYTSQDADIEGKEGIYYVWKAEEIKEILDSDIDCKVFSLRYGISNKGSFGKNRNILFINKTKDEVAKKLGISKSEVESSLKNSKAKVLRARRSRYKIKTDKKIITSYNALMIYSLAEAYLITGKEQYLKSAKNSADFLLKHSYADKTVYRKPIGGSSTAISGFLDDYAYLVRGLIKLLEASGNWDYFYNALSVHERMEELFGDKDKGGFYYNPKDRKPPLIRTKFAYDESLPSPNAIALYNYKVIYEITGKFEYKETIKKSLEYFSEQINKSPSSCSSMIQAMDIFWKGGSQVVILSPSRNTQLYSIKQISSFFIPHLSIYTVSKEEAESERWKNIMLSAGKFDMGGEGSFYLCTERTCYPPTTELPELLANLEKV